MNRLSIILPLLTLLLPQITIATDLEKQPVSARLVSAKILGGQNAKPSSWPWASAILHAHIPNIYDAQYCGGALIAEDWILTAGHCVWLYSQNGTPVGVKAPSTIEVAVGAYDLNNYNGARRAVTSVIPHPSFDPQDLDHDIALLKLESPSDQEPITIYTGESREILNHSLEGKSSTVIGWGQDNTSSSYPSTLQEVTLPIVSQSLCNTQQNTTLGTSQICAGFEENTQGKDACNGDSGGPMMVQIDNTWTHVGLVSSGLPCSKNGAYGVYARTSSFDDFIRLHAPNAKFTPLEEPPVEPEPDATVNIVPLLYPLLSIPLTPPDHLVLNE